VPQQKKRARVDGVGDNWLLSPEEESSREFKVRIVERLTIMERRLLGSADTTMHNERTACESAPALDQDLIQDEQVLETISREYIKRILETLLSKLQAAFGKEECIRQLNAVDSQGAALAHYLAALNYHEVFPVM